jgi:phenylpropionate dioxygenase-like ring-hydroxylating dioxygenase large terminal subunit
MLLMTMVASWTSTTAFFHNKGVMPFWYPIVPTKELITNKKNIQKVVFCDTPLVCYKKKQQFLSPLSNSTLLSSYVLHSDICPHQGASFGDAGSVNEEGNLSCGYHGFEFCDGNFCKIPNPVKNAKSFRSKISLQRFPVQFRDDFLFFRPLMSGTEKKDVDVEVDEQDPQQQDIFYPPEEKDVNFRGVDGYTVVNNNYMTVCENLLDMLHISYVHSFGSRDSPLPYDIRTKRLSNTSFQAQFMYAPNADTISTRVGNAPKVIVQNEYHLPTNTITRVFANDLIKTVFTRSVPISKNKTLLYWKIYRNFWVDPFFPWFNALGDWLTRFLMEKTVMEDIKILENVYEEHREGPLITKYDITISNFRKDVRKYTK